MKKILLITFLLVGSIFKMQASGSPQLPIIPYPTHIQILDGNFALNENVAIVVTDTEKFKDEALYLQTLLQDILGKKIAVSSKAGKNVIEIRYEANLPSVEAYKLDISSDKVIISAKDGHGAFYAIQTLRQIIPLGSKGTVQLPNLKIEDSPAFTWRGMHLDISRHFFGMDYLKKHIDRLSFYKMNKFHIHLTDDQGWRIEIKQYPKLTEIGSWRSLKNKHDSICIERSKENPNFEIDPRYIHEKDGKTVYGGYYTQEEMKEVIAYAKERHVEIIPEVDMPGHMMAAIRHIRFCLMEKPVGESFSLLLSVHARKMYIHLPKMCWARLPTCFRPNMFTSEPMKSIKKHGRTRKIAGNL